MPESGRPGELHPHNPAVVLGNHGIWNEDSLPLTDWEVPERRVVIPSSLQASIGLPVPILRVSRNIDNKQLNKHADVREHHERLSERLVTWSHWRQKAVDQDNPNDEWEVVIVIYEEDRVWPLLVAFGTDKSGSLNLITSHRKNDRFLRRLRGGETDFSERLK